MATYENTTQQRGDPPAPPPPDTARFRLQSAQLELLAITEILGRLARPGETPLESCLQWFVPKLDAVSAELDQIDAELSGTNPTPK